jgi:hypothetical protein
VNPVRKLGYNTEIRSSSPDGPEKILVLFLWSDEHITVCENNFCSKEVVDDEAVLSY